MVGITPLKILLSSISKEIIHHHLFYMQKNDYSVELDITGDAMKR